MLIKIKKKIKRILKNLIPALLTIFTALVIGGILIAVAGHNPLQAYTQMFKGAFGSAHRFSETFTKAVPLMIMALGTSIAFKSQIWNIGGDGQFTIGAILSLAVGIYLPLPAPVVFILSVAAAFIGGALWGGLAGWLRARFNANEVITTLMLNYVASYLLSYLIYGPMMDPDGHGFPQTQMLKESLRLPVLFKGMRIHGGIVAALIVLIAVWLFWRSTTGFKVKVTGASRNVAQYAGISVGSTIILTMVLSGGLAGIAGWNEVYGIHYRLLDGLASGFGSLAIVIALLGGLQPIGIMVSSFFFAAMIVGGNTMQRLSGIPYSIVDILQALVIIFVICRTVFDMEKFKKLFVRRKQVC